MKSDWKLIYGPWIKLTVDKSKYLSKHVIGKELNRNCIVKEIMLNFLNSIYENIKSETAISRGDVL